MPYLFPVAGLCIGALGEVNGHKFTDTQFK